MPIRNFDDVEDSTFELLPEDTYFGRVTSCTSKETSKGEVWELTLTIQEGEHKGSKVADALMWFGKGEQRTKAVLSGMGFDVHGEKNWHPSNLMQIPCDLDIIHRTRTYDGKEITESKPSYDGYRRRMDAPWKPQSEPTPISKDGFADDAPF